MATIYRCDRCHSESVEPHHNIVYPTLDYRGCPTDYTMTRELCNDCIGKIHEFMKPLPELKARER